MEILVLYYSRSGAVKALAQHIGRGISSIDGISPRIRTVPPVSLVTEAVQNDIPESGYPYVCADDLEECVGLALGSPTRFGHMAAPLKYFLDQTTAQWLSGVLDKKPACVFTSSSSMHGGQESTLLSMMLPLLHHGMLMVGLPYTEPGLHTTQSGGSPYGATHVSGSQNTARLDNTEKQLAQSLGARLAHTAKCLSPSR